MTSARSLFSWARRESREELAAVQPLTPDDAAALHLPWHSTFSNLRLASHLERLPGHGWRTPAGEYLIAEPWRRRAEISTVAELHARRGREALMKRAAADLAAAGKRLLLREADGTAKGRHAAQEGLVRLERIVFYRLDNLTARPPVRRLMPLLDFVPYSPAYLPALLEVDNAAFPWLWWNSEAEFRIYSNLLGVQIWLGLADGVPVGYASFTTNKQWANLDRLATLPQHHGKGYGAGLLAFALARMEALGIYQVNLSTQEDNHGSQRLYKGFGFQQTVETHDIYGQWLNGG